MGMLYRRLGNSELEVSELALGTWLTYGVSIDEDFEYGFEGGDGL